MNEYLANIAAIITVTIIVFFALIDFYFLIHFIYNLINQNTIPMIINAVGFSLIFSILSLVLDL